MNLILASGSPRRSELLSNLGLTFTVRPVDADESLTPGLTPEEQVMALSRKKAEASEVHPGEVILTADTVVVLEDTILGKPRSENEAEEMLLALSGRAHRVLTGITVATEEGMKTDFVSTEVHFRALSLGEIRAYIATKEPMDKAGAYGIQGLGGLFVEKLVGDYFNVVGLPVCRTAQLLLEAGIPVLEDVQ